VTYDPDLYGPPEYEPPEPEADGIAQLFVAAAAEICQAYANLDGQEASDA
jgi:hypothetical protein